jgi:hypothetical protein
MSRFVALERSVLYSPAWFVPFDDYARQVRSIGVTVQLDRWDNGNWLLQDNIPAVRTPSGAIAYPGLGRRGDPLTAQPQRHRARFAATGYQPLYPADGEPFAADLVGVEFLVQPYNDDHPPATRTEPRLVRLLPSVSFPYPPGLRTVHGAVLDAATQQPIVNALVEAQGRTSRDLTPWHERTLSDARGDFRLALRWEGEKANETAVEETFTLRATERPGRTGSLVVRLPQELDRRHVIEIREQ